jgi:hypothetical protein
MTAIFQDSDTNQSLTYTITGKPTWITDSKTGVIFTLNGTAPHSDIGDHNVTFKASDSYDYIEDNLTITIALNDAPVAPIAPAAALNKTIHSFEGKNESTTYPVFTDPEGDTITYSMTNNDGTPINSTWITFDPATRILNYLPIASLSTPLILKLIATDTHNPDVSNDITFNINFAPRDNPAVVSRTKDFIALHHTFVRISKNIITDDDTIASYALTFANGTAAPSWISMTLWTASASGEFEFDGTYPAHENKLYEFSISATDSHGLIGTANFFIQTRGKYKYVIL